MGKSKRQPKLQLSLELKKKNNNNIVLLHLNAYKDNPINRPLDEKKEEIGFDFKEKKKD